MPSIFGPVPTTADQTLTDLLRRWAAERAHQRAFTFVDYPDLGSPGRRRTLTWGQLAVRAQALAGQLSRTARPGDRVALLLPQGLDYVTGFLACLLAHVVAVPLFAPDLPGHEGRLNAVLADCEPACALVTAAGEGPAQAYARGTGIAHLPFVAIGAQRSGPGAAEDAAENTAAASALADLPPPGPDEVAYLQYTSGSTRIPAGVMISHRNVLANAEQALSAFGPPDSPGTLVGWLPLFHDMGLVLSVAAPVFRGWPSVLMDPVAFLEQPARWLRLLAQYPGTMSAAPNFAYDYCASRVAPHQVAGLRLDRVRSLVNGSEPVRRESVRRFQSAFGGAGLRPEAHCPSYGLAEATVFVATDGPDEPLHEVTCRRDGLAEGRIVSAPEPQPALVAANLPGGRPDSAAARNLAKAADAVTTLISCGLPVGQELLIVDPATKAVLPENRVGEILLRGPNIGLGYWKHTELTTETFEFVLPSTGDSPWLRTGDLGALHDGRLLVTGRLKDLLIADGRNHYPQDVEETIQSALDYVRRGRIAVFSVPGEEGELVVAVAEHLREHSPDDAQRAEADRIARARVAMAHGLRLDRIVLVAPDCVARTSSGKVSRSACRAAYLRGEYADPWESGR
jgi:acyl-CoA synthetase (AMP-forming)/AMP-acid ligase II